jgi:hypothetical protein
VEGRAVSWPATPGTLETLEVEALVVDRYLDSLLAAAERRAADAPADAALDPALRAAALRLRDEVVRVHPSFRFEERLARRLAAAAAAMRLAPAAGGEVAPLPLMPELAAFGGGPADAADAGDTGRPADAGDLGRPTGAADPGDPVRPADAGDPGWPPGAPHPLLVGGAVTSALLSIAGAAFVAWRLTRGAADSPLARSPLARSALDDALDDALAGAAADDPLARGAPEDPLARALRTVRAALPRGLA